MANENGYYWNRIGAVELLACTKKGVERVDFVPTTRYEGLNFRFNVTFQEDKKQGTQGTGSVGILGLNANTIRRWASAEKPDVLRKKQMFIKVYAGYAKDGPIENCEIFTLPYVGALPTSPPEMWLNFDCPNNVLSISPRVLKSPFLGEPTTIKAVFEEYVKDLNEIMVRESGGTYKMLLKWRVDEKTESLLPMIRSFDYSGMLLKDFIEEVNSWGLVRAYSTNKFNASRGKTKFYVYVEPLPSVVQNKSFDQTSLQGPPAEISADNGMVGFPEFGQSSGVPFVRVKCLMRHDISFGDLISVKSKFMDAPYEKYKVNKVNYNGEFRGQPWYVTYEAFGLGVDKTPGAMQKALEKLNGKPDSGKKDGEDEDAGDEEDDTDE